MSADGSPEPLETEPPEDLEAIAAVVMSPKSSSEPAAAYTGPSEKAPPKTARSGKRQEAVAPEIDEELLEDEDLAWYDDMVSMLTPRSRAQWEGNATSSPSEETPKSPGNGFLSDVMGSLSSGLDAVTGVVGAMKFWEGDGSKSPRHHFNEGEIFKGMFSSGGEEESQVPNDFVMKVPGNKAAQAGSASASGSPAAEREELQVPPCIRPSGTPSSKKGFRVVFEAVEWRNHEVLLDGSGGLPSSGTALGIGWKVESERWAPIDDFEKEREGQRRPLDLFMMDGFVPPKERAARFYEVGYTKEEVSASELATFKTNRRRKASVADLSDMEQ